MALVPTRFPDTQDIEIEEVDLAASIPQHYQEYPDSPKEEPQTANMPYRFPDTGDSAKPDPQTGTVAQRFPQVEQVAIASYNYVDLVEGTGIRNFYPIVSELSGSTTYGMVTSTAYRSAEVEKHRTDAGTYTFTFDAGEFNLPQTVRGTAYFNVNVYEIGNAGTAYLRVKLQHYDGTTATDISSEYFTPALSAAGGDEEPIFIPMALTETKFNKGDNLRLIVKMVTTHADVDYYMGHDPSNSTSPSTNLSNTQMSLGVPFRLDNVA